MKRGVIMENVGKFVKRGLSLTLAAGLIAGSIAGCGKGSKEESLIDQASKTSKEYVYRCEKLDFIESKDYNSILVNGSKIYASTYANDGYITISSFNSDGSDLSTIKIPEAENENHGYISLDKDGNIYSILSIYSFVDDDVELYNDPDEEDGVAHAGDDQDDGAAHAGDDQNGSAAADSTETAAALAETSEVAVDTDPAENNIIGDYGYEDGDAQDQQFLVKYDPSGKEILRVDLNDRMSEDSYFSIYKMIYTEKYGLLMSSTMGIERFDEGSNSFKMILDTSESSSEYYQTSISLYNGFDGTVFSSVWGEKGIELRTFDPETGTFGEKSEQFSTFDDYAFFGGNGFDLYVSKSDGIYGYDRQKDETEKLLDYANSDLNVNYALSSIVAISDSEFIANIPDESYNYSLRRLTKVPADQVKDKTIITLAGNFVDYTVRQKVYSFNQDNDEYKIKIVDYSSLSMEEDYNAGLNQFNLDIVSGNTPDIMVFSSEEPVDSYINKGLFVDLLPYLKNDDELKNVEFVDGIFEALKTGDKLYQIVPSYYISTVAVKTSLLKGQKSLTLKDCRDMIDAKGLNYSYAFGMVNKETVLNNGLMAAGERFIDWENKKCNYNSDEFIELLEFANNFPNEISEDMWMDFSDTAYMSDDSLFNFSYLSGFRSYRRTMDGTFGADITLIGFPNETGEGGTVVHPNMRFTISSHSKYSDTCWNFIRQFLLEEYQDSLEYDFPIRKSSLDKQAKKSMEKLSWTDDEGKKHYEDDYVYLGDKQVKINPLNQKDVDYITDFVCSLDNIYSPNQNVMAIILEEASAFFSGQKSAKEVADIIQSRLAIYVNENS